MRTRIGGNAAVRVIMPEYASSWMLLTVAKSISVVWNQLWKRTLVFRTEIPMKNDRRIIAPLTAAQVHRAT
ncbi:hypothetical protein [Leifsonia shinshuensis]|uniref:Uncharacterized protein n=1 Tax=Leifsonia shinshuensis TaxID=150026 RepID=A0A853CXU2_9MICO|nr:hypothetical protein [Leifsonia shinshuensis]NYJ25946.1 hypothetical protein [Leifsonia shinshuensis]